MSLKDRPSLEPAIRMTVSGPAGREAGREAGSGAAVAARQRNRVGRWQSETVRRWESRKVRKRFSGKVRKWDSGKVRKDDVALNTREELMEAPSVWSVRDPSTHYGLPCGHGWSIPRKFRGIDLVASLPLSPREWEQCANGTIPHGCAPTRRREGHTRAQWYSRAKGGFLQANKPHQTEEVVNDSAFTEACGVLCARPGWRSSPPQGLLVFGCSRF